MTTTDGVRTAFWSLVCETPDDEEEPTWDACLRRLQDGFAAALAENGIAGYVYQVAACPSLGPETVARAPIVTTYPNWSDEYRAALAGADPVLERAVREPAPFTWQELAESTSTPAGDHFFERAAAHGLGSASTFPVHAESGVAALTVVPFDGVRPTAEPIRQILYLFAHYFHRRVRRPIVEIALAVSTRRRSLLSPRETEALTWASHGKSTDEIASALGIAGKSVEYHLDGARRKLQVANRTHAVARAMALGILPMIADGWESSGKTPGSTSRGMDPSYCSGPGNGVLE